MKPIGLRVAIVAGILAVVLLCVAGWLFRRELVLWYYFAPLGRNAQGYPEYRHRQTGIVMVRLPGGTFWMGAQRSMVQKEALKVVVRP